MTSAVFLGPIAKPRRWIGVVGVGGWILGAALMAASFLRIARNIRVEDTKGSAQIIAVNEPVLGAVRWAAGDWVLFVSIPANQRLERERVCAAVNQPSSVTPPVQVIYVATGGSAARLGDACPAAGRSSVLDGELTRAATVMRNANLQMMLLSDNGGYVFGSNRIRDVAVVDRFRDPR